MMKFVYDSLDTVKKLKHPTKKDFVKLTLAIFGMVIFAWAFFMLADVILHNVYNWFYAIMK